MAEKEEHAPAEGAEPKKSKLPIIIVAVVLVLVLIIGGVVAFLMMKGHDEHGEDNATKTEQSAEGHDKEAKAEDGHGESGGHGESEGGHKKSSGSTESVEVGPMYPLTVFIVNLMSDTGGKYLKTTVSLELSDPKLTHEVESKKDRIRDYILGILSSKTVEEIATTKGKEDLKAEIADKINGNLKDGEIKNVYFTDFVIQ